MSLEKEHFMRLMVVVWEKNSKFGDPLKTAK